MMGRNDDGDLKFWILRSGCEEMGLGWMGGDDEDEDVSGVYGSAILSEIFCGFWMMCCSWILYR